MFNVLKHVPHILTAAGVGGGGAMVVGLASGHADIGMQTAGIAAAITGGLTTAYFWFTGPSVATVARHAQDWALRKGAYNTEIGEAKVKELHDEPLTEREEAVLRKDDENWAFAQQNAL